LVTEAEGGAANAGTVSSYRTNELGAVAVATGSLWISQTSPCWMAATPDGRFAYAANTPVSSISGFAVARDGSLSLIDQNGPLAQMKAGSLPFDMGVDTGSRFLYTLNRGSKSIGAFSIGENGRLHSLGKTVGLPASAFGLAVR
jgi:6-phosphogluconolactonase (cycloisomerase 2 family)